MKLPQGWREDFDAKVVELGNMWVAGDITGAQYNERVQLVYMSEAEAERAVKEAAYEQCDDVHTLHYEGTLDAAECEALSDQVNKIVEVW